MDITLTASATQTYLTCPRKFQWAYVEQIRPEQQAEYFRIGGAYHKAMELFDLGVDWQNIMAEIHRLCIDEHEAHAVLAMATAHEHYYEGRQFQLVEPEQVWKKAIGGVDCTGKIDRIVTLPDGRRAVMEYKTTSRDISPGSMYWRRLKLNVQIGMYQHAADADTVFYDVVRKPTIKPKQVPLLDDEGLKIVVDDETGERVLKKNGDPRQSAAAGMTLQSRIETPEEYGQRVHEQMVDDPERFFQRVECPRIEGDMAAVAADVRDVSRLVSLDIYPRNANACDTYGKCEYFELCVGNVEPGGGVPAGFVKLDTAHPELSE